MTCRASVCNQCTAELWLTSCRHRASIWGNKQLPQRLPCRRNRPRLRHPGEGVGRQGRGHGQETRSRNPVPTRNHARCRQPEPLQQTSQVLKQKNHRKPSPPPTRPTRQPGRTPPPATCSSCSRAPCRIRAARRSWRWRRCEGRPSISRRLTLRLTSSPISSNPSTIAVRYVHTFS